MNLKNKKKMIYLIRHGETAWSQSKQHTGRTDIPLTAEGEKQASCLKNRLSGIEFKKVLVSPLIRAQRTCELAGLKEQAELNDDLFEWDYGEYEGLTTQEIRLKIPKWNIFENGPQKGETLNQVAHRASHLIEQISQIDGNVALFSSGHISRVLGALWASLDPLKSQFLALSTASVSILGYEHEWKAIRSWNDTSHLN